MENQIEIVDRCIEVVASVIEDDWQIVPKDRILEAINQLLDIRLELM